MLSDLTDKQFLVGVKQSRRALKDGLVQTAYLAQNVEDSVRIPLETLCKELGVPVIEVPTMQELGSACGISVGAAVAVVLR
ncbi:MAG: ribosomal L7Ae/L30e/S12e/Gadd45 family protein [Oscillospiraceae bacterium]|nr:ribosomal L7Ae/L30e/S12e/Gadd45 family protein [Oscillospiraceae bacterium]